MTELAEPTAPLNKRQRQAAKIADAASGPIGWMLLKILLLAVVDAIALYAAFVLFGQQEWLVLGLVVAVTVLVNYIYFSRKRVPAKYLTPGIIFLIIFQVFTLLYTGYIGFTNYGTGHNGTKDQAISSLLASSQERVEDSATYPVTVVEQFGTYGLLVTDPESGDALLGTAEQPLAEVDADFEGGQAVAVDGWNTLPLAKVFTLSAELEKLSVPFSDDPNDGSLRAPDGQKGYLYVSSLEYDADADTITDTTTGAVYADTGEGAFTAEDGAELLPGWQTTVGFDNFVRAVTDESIRGPLISVTIWTFVFALLSVATTFFLGLLLALVFNNTRMRFRNGYRIILILPYAFPAFLSALVWAGMMNESFGFINQVIFGGADIPWLSDPNLAKVSVLLVNLWLGFPYMFLVCMGALQGIPEDVNEAAVMDGANPWQVFRRIKLPLLLVTVAPLLISSFAFNFNNFNLIYMLTKGGPRFDDVSIPVGHTDILISMVYKVAFTGQSRDYGLASAFTILIFIVVATISIISFRKTKALEELN
ncbi:arabinogalactan oligomer/maltooligosaccharide transport system permease protein [Microbacterium phyllosphaerae]|uniref:Maltose/maltodextrin transport system permease protein n=1 Tax=Microbacterium phyllosphaerae TaxID=124798 RepID=A0ABS4WU67_9MICO|nr:ABC transporter permease subunit [Microbacterium phyllosphaerae]MBP2379735.1 arabinogalactan oligomer/maltooligosaccharide transport system permease protein [Microbacterium phyllosphaerae]